MSPEVPIPVPADSPPLRLDVFLAGVLVHCSRRTAQRAVAAGAVRVNGHRARKGTTVSAGDLVTVAETLDRPPTLQPNAELRVPILYQDAAVIVVDKPAGMPSHALRAAETGTVANFLLAHFPELGCLEARPLEAGSVHRLDTETSGVLLVGRTPGAYRALREQFNAQQVDKEYRAVVHGDVGSPGTITTPLAHDRRHPGRMRVVTAQAAESGRPARTAYLPVERFGEYTLLAVRIRTGVMHQIRVHLASLHHPIVGDRRYGSPATPGAPARHLLHASRLAFRHPETGQPIQITSALPEDFRAFLGQVGRNVESQRVKGNRSESDPSTFRLLDR